MKMAEKESKNLKLNKKIIKTDRCIMFSIGFS